MREKTVLIIGGDKRQLRLKELLEEYGCNCLYENKDADLALLKLRQADIIALPVPACKDGVNIYTMRGELTLSVKALIEATTVKQIIVGGMFSKEMCELMNKRNIIFRDLGKQEEFLVYNAGLTAQASLRLMLENTGELITGKRVLVTGYGRIARILSDILISLKCKVTVAARDKARLQYAFASGAEVMDILEIGGCCSDFDFIFNTVPSELFTPSDVYRLKDKAVYLELASKPYGACREDFEKFGKKYISADSLPGRYMSLASAEKISEYIQELI